MIYFRAMSKPKIAIIGRPNVGKSSLFNRLCKSRQAIVHAMEGITRDRIFGEVECEKGFFDLIDTAGLTGNREEAAIQQQWEFALLEADGFLLVVDAQVGITKIDLELAKRLLRLQKPITLAVNKLDELDQHLRIHEFVCSGIQKICPISAIQNLGIDQLLEKITEDLVLPKEKEQRSAIKVALFGRENVGKSTLLNRLSGQERSVVDPRAGTTRDSVEVLCNVDGELFSLFDTAGIRKTNKEKEAVEKFAKMRTLRAVEQSNLTLLMIDVQKGLTTQEKRLLTQLEEWGKPTILLINKWDLTSHFRMEHVELALKKQHSFTEHLPCLMISAKEGRNCDQILPLAKKLYDQSRVRIQTAQLNRFMEKAMINHPPPAIKGKRLQIYYVTQISTEPPTFVFFINHMQRLARTYKQYLINQFREEFELEGSFFTFLFRQKRQKDRRQS